MVEISLLSKVIINIFRFYSFKYDLTLIQNSAGIIRSISMEFLKTSDCTDETQKDETCLQFKMKKYYIKAWKISQKSFEYEAVES